MAKIAPYPSCPPEQHPAWLSGSSTVWTTLGKINHSYPPILKPFFGDSAVIKRTKKINRQFIKLWKK